MSGTFNSLQQVEIFFSLLFEKKQVSPRPPIFVFDTDVYLASGQFKVPALSTDLTLNFPSLPSVKAVGFMEDGGDTADVTVKVNGSSDARAVKPILVLTDAITALTATNADATSARYINWFAVTEYTR